MTPIAVIGMACRLPHGINSPEQLWDALLAGEDLVGEIPAERWDADSYYDPEPGAADRSVSRWGGFLNDVAGFDPEFFGIGEREAVALDPQHRLLLEVSWEAVEHAGISPTVRACIGADDAATPAGWESVGAWARGTGRVEVTVADDEPIRIMYTSGTESRPKGALLSSREKGWLEWRVKRARERGFADRDPGTEPRNSGTIAVPIMLDERVAATIGITYFRRGVSAADAARYVQALKRTATAIAKQIVSLERVGAAGSDA